MCEVCQNNDDPYERNRSLTSVESMSRWGVSGWGVGGGVTPLPWGGNCNVKTPTTVPVPVPVLVPVPVSPNC